MRRRTGYAARMEGSRRVWITGIGLVTALGTGVEPFWAALRAGWTGTARVTAADAGPAADGRRVGPPGRLGALVVMTGRLALDDAGLVPGSRGHVRTDRLGVAIGSALGEPAAAGGAEPPARSLARLGGPAATLGAALGVHGPVVSYADGDAAGVVAIGEAFHAVRDGRADVMLAGGADLPLVPSVIDAFAGLGLLADGEGDGAGVRPFDRRRTGCALGEGAAILVLEHAEAAEARGARPYAELRGYATTSDGGRTNGPDPSGRQAARAVRLALADGRLRAADLDWLIAHGIATQAGDLAEATAIRTALGSRWAGVPVAATKGAYGHPLAASGAIEAAIGALALARDWAPGTPGLGDPDPAIVALLPGLAASPVDGPFRAILGLTLGIGGRNAAIALARPRPA